MTIDSIACTCNMAVLGLARAGHSRKKCSGEFDPEPHSEQPLNSSSFSCLGSSVLSPVRPRAKLYKRILPSPQLMEKIKKRFRFPVTLSKGKRLHVGKPLLAPSTSLSLAERKINYSNFFSANAMSNIIPTIDFSHQLWVWSATVILKLASFPSKTTRVARDEKNTWE